jgi:hypothetical protein
MLEEIITAAKEQAAERLASPIIGSFAVSWCLWNYKFLVILFSQASVSVTFALISKLAFPDTWSIAMRGVVLPLVSAAAYIFLYPYPAKFVYGFTRRRQKELNELRQEIEDETLLTREESRVLRSEALRADIAHREEMDRLNAELATAKAEIARMASAPSPSPAPEAPSPIPRRLTGSQSEMLQKLLGVGGRMFENALISRKGPEKVQGEFDVGELLRLELVDKQFDPDQVEH